MLAETIMQINYCIKISFCVYDTLKAIGLSVLVQEDPLTVEALSVLESYYSTFKMPEWPQYHGTNSSY